MIWFEYNPYWFLKDIIGFNFVSSVSRDHNFHQWPCGVWSLGSVDQITYIRVLVFLEHSFFKFLQTGTSDRNIIDRDQRLKFLDFWIYPLSVYFNSPFKHKKEAHTAPWKPSMLNMIQYILHHNSIYILYTLFPILRYRSPGSPCTLYTIQPHLLYLYYQTFLNTSTKQFYDKCMENVVS